MTGVNATSVTEAPRESVWAWWTEYDEHDHQGRAFRHYGDVTRRVIWSEPDKGTEYVDEGKVLGLPFEARTVIEFTPPERLHAFTDSGPRGCLDRDYWFEALPGAGTRITARAEYMPPRVVSRRFTPITDTALHAALAYDLRAHVREFEKAWKAGRA